MIVCVCNAVSDRTIRRAMSEGHDTFDAIQLELGVGTRCGKCVASACEVLCEARLEARDRHAASTAPVRFVSPSSTREVALA